MARSFDRTDHEVSFRTVLTVNRHNALPPVFAAFISPLPHATARYVHVIPQGRQRRVTVDLLATVKYLLQKC